jgi:putative heme transporter
MATMATEGDNSRPAAAPPAVVPWVDTLAQYSWRGLVILVAAAAVIWTAAFLYLVTIPIILAIVLATFCVPLARRLEASGFPPAAAAGTVVVGGLVLLGGALAAMAPAFIRQTADLVPTIQDGVDEFFVWLEEGPIGLSRQDVTDFITDAGEQTEGLGEVATTIVVTIGSIVAALVLTIVLLFFLVKDGPQIVNWIMTRCPDRYHDAVAAVGARTWRSLGGFMRGTATVALIDAVGIAIGLVIIGVPLVLPLAFLVFLGGFIPVVGALVTGLIAVLVAWAAGGFGMALAALGVVILVQQIESNVLQPVIMKKAVSLHPVVILAGITAGAIIAGIIGAFLAVPVAAMAAAAGNELRLRHESRLAGVPLGPTPIGGPWAGADVSGPEAATDGADAAVDDNDDDDDPPADPERRDH